MVANMKWTQFLSLSVHKHDGEIGRWINGAWTTEFGKGNGLCKALGRNRTSTLLEVGMKKAYGKRIHRRIGICKGYPFDFLLFLSSTLPQTDGDIFTVILAQTFALALVMRWT